MDKIRFMSVYFFWNSKTMPFQCAYASRVLSPVIFPKIFRINWYCASDVLFKRASSIFCWRSSLAFSSALICA